LRNITKDYPALNGRVSLDIATQDEIERLAAEERKKRLQDIRETSNESADISNEEDLEGTDPFKPISVMVCYHIPLKCGKCLGVKKSHDKNPLFA